MAEVRERLQHGPVVLEVEGVDAHGHDECGGGIRHLGVEDGRHLRDTRSVPVMTPSKNATRM